MDKAEEAYEKMFELREEKTFEEYKKRGIEILDEYAQQDAVNFLDWIANMDYPVLVGGKTKPDVDYQKYKTWGDLYIGFKNQS